MTQPQQSKQQQQMYRTVATTEEEGGEESEQEAHAGGQILRIILQAVLCWFLGGAILYATALLATYKDHTSSYPNNVDFHHWAFQLPEHQQHQVPKMVLSKEGTHGSVFVINLEDRFRYYKHHPLPGESRYDYRLELGFLRMSTTEGILCLYRSNPFWFQAHWLATADNRLPLETMMILGKDRDDSSLYRLVLALIQPDGPGVTSGSFRAEPNSYSSILLASETGGPVAIYMGKGSNPYDLVKEAAAFGRKLASPTEDPEEELPMQLNRLPPFARHLGWCTWNAMYKDMTGDKILSGVRALQTASIPIRWMIIDDGWQHTTTDGWRRLAKLDSCPTKFGPDDKESSLLSLKETVRLLKVPREEGGHGLQTVLAWHAVAGYWLGLQTPEMINNTNGDDRWRLPNASLFYSHFSKGLIQTGVQGDDSIDQGLGVPDNATDFFERYYEYMKYVGLDGVKIDEQAIAGVLRPWPTKQDTEDYLHRHQISVQLMDAIASTVGKFQANDRTTPMIHCMSNAPETMYRIPSLFPGPSLPLFRASDDFMPDIPESHGTMIANLAFNSMLLGHLTTPDWDMFQTVVKDNQYTSGHLLAKLHAVARSISGGPIYISDDPKITPNTTLLASMVCEDGTILPCAGVGQPVRSSLLRDPFVGDEPLRIWNVNGIPNREITSGVVGLFQLANTSRTTTIELCPTDVEAFRTQQFANRTFVAMSFNTQNAVLLNDTSSPYTLEIPGGEWLWSDVVTVVPITSVELPATGKRIDLAPLGFLRMLNSAGAIVRKQTSVTPDQQVVLQLSLRGCGPFSVLTRLTDEHEEIRTESLSFVTGEAVEGTRYSLKGYLQGDGFHTLVFDLPCQDLRPDEERWVALNLTSNI